MELSVYATMFEVEHEHWWYRVRRELVQRLIADLHQPKILEVGCGTGKTLSEVGGVGVDISEEAISFCRLHGVEVTKGSATAIPHPDESFDVVLALDVLEHVEDDEKALAEMRRVLKPGGRLITFVPCFNVFWGHDDILSHHVRRYTLPELVGKLGEFTIVENSYFNTLLSPLALVSRFMQRHFSKTPSLHTEDVGILNPLFYWIFHCEIFLLRFIRFPFGVSGLLVCKKPLRA